MRIFNKNAFKIVSREHLNELGEDLNLIQFIKSKVPSNHFGENIHGNIFGSTHWSHILGQRVPILRKVYSKSFNTLC